MIAKTEKVNGKQIEVHEDRYGYWVKIDGSGLYQRGRMRVRTFSTVGTAWKAALEEVRS